MIHQYWQLVKGRTSSKKRLRRMLRSIANSRFRSVMASNNYSRIGGSWLILDRFSSDYSITAVRLLVIFPSCVAPFCVVTPKT
jgi:hypothetical protein